jgi:long-subunit fatty acid transport protein
MGAGLAMGVASMAMAQSMALPASDPVGISRGGAGVAYGRSLEAAGLNPALLPTLQEDASAYLGLGEELQSSQASLQSNQQLWSTSDRNRFLPAFGAAWKLKPNLFLGLKLDSPFMRHGELAADAAGRFSGTRFDLTTHRLEAQAGWSPEGKPQFSIGLGIGVTRASYEGAAALRLRVPTDPNQPGGAGNPYDGLVEESATQSGAVTRPSFTLGARWALSPRWTFGATYQSAVRGDLGLSAGQGPATAYTANDGFSAAPLGLEDRAATLMGLSTAQPGKGTLRLPPRASLGVRQRVNQLFTWELDLRSTGTYILPTWASVATPSGTVRPAQNLVNLKRTYGFSAMGEFTLTKSFVLRGGVSGDSAALDDQYVNPLTGGQRTANFSIGCGYQIWGGELDFGYQFRQAQDAVNRSLDRTWSVSGPRLTDTPVRVEGMGHLFSFGFRKSF